MEKISTIIVTDPNTGATSEHILIDKGNGEYSSMSKEFYEAQQAALKTPMVINETSAE